MTPVAFKTVYLFFALFALPQVFAGPACAKRHYAQGDCIKKCGGHWGYGGHYMGHSKWGPVMSSPNGQDTDLDSFLSTACGSDKTATSDPAATPAIPPPSPPGGSPPPYSGYPVNTPDPKNPPKSTYTSSSTPSTPTTSSTSSSTSTSHQPPPTSTPPTPPPSPSPSPPPVKHSSPSPSHSKDKTSTPSPTPSVPPSTSDTNSLETEVLAGHNSVRAKHGAVPLTWSDKLAAAAQSWASGCKFKHSEGEVGPYGENLAAGTGQFTATDGINMWVAEEKDYDPKNPTYSHYTQVVWKGTTEVGCAVQKCGAGTIFAMESHFVVCEYNPFGNVDGQYGQNVQ